MKPKINREITAKEVRVIGPAKENLGIMKLEDALALVNEQEKLDLIEITETTNPPVVRLMNYDKWRYEESKRERKEEFLKKSKSSSVKQIQISPRASQNDLLIKLKQLEKFLNENYIVEIQMRLRGREKANKEWVDEKLNNFLNMITLKYRIISGPKTGGRGINIQIEKIK